MGAMPEWSVTDGLPLPILAESLLTGQPQIHKKKFVKYMREIEEKEGGM